MTACVSAAGFRLHFYEDFARKKAKIHLNEKKTNHEN